LQRDGNEVADAININNNMGRLAMNESALQESDHRLKKWVAQDTKIAKKGIGFYEYGRGYWRASGKSV
jgi:hypothetical protein